MDIVPTVQDLLKRGNELLLEGNYEDALSHFEQALLLEPGDPALWNKKAVTLRSLGRYDDAIECFNRALALDPADKKAS